jgi:hypothetical protein
VFIRLLPILMVSGIVSAQSASGPKQTPPPIPGFANFSFSAPDPVALGRLWLDVGMFHPFTGKVTRQTWDPIYFELMNKIAQGRIPLREAAASAIGALEDPGSMVLGEAEGEGKFILPLVFEARKDGIWIVGGSRSSLQSVFGPIKRINGESISKFMEGHVGTATSLAQQIAVLQMASQSPQAKDWSFQDWAENSLIVKSTSTLPTDAWVEGGWKGTPLHELAKWETNDLQKVVALDLRTLAWSPAASRALNRVMSNLAASVNPSGSAFLTKWFHKGYVNGLPGTGPSYETSLISEGLPLRRSSLPERHVEIVPPPVFIPRPGIILPLGGWAIPKGLSIPSEKTIYSIAPGVRIQLTTSFLSETAPNTIPSMFAGPIDFLASNRPAAWKSLSVPAAKSLAAASILNWTAHFGFIKPEIQEEAFKNISTLPDKSTSVHDLLLRSSFFLQEPHTTSFALDFRDLAGGDWEAGTATKKSRLPFIGTVRPDGTIQVHRPAQNTPIKVGAIVKEINHRPMKELIDEMKIRVPTPNNPFRICKDMGMLFPYNTPLEITFTNPGEPSRREKIDPVTYDGPWDEGDSSFTETFAAQGWTYINNPRGIAGKELIEGLKKGKNYVFDLRFNAVGVSDDGQAFPNSVAQAVYYRTPGAPITWGNPPSESSFVYEESQTYNTHSTGEHYPGKVVMLVWGVSQSSLEATALINKLLFLSNSYIVGTPTSGVLGFVSYLKLPIGDSDRFEMMSATGLWPGREGATVQYRGLSLDLEFTETEIQNAFQAGSTDPYLTVMSKHLKDLK